MVTPNSPAPGRTTVLLAYLALALTWGASFLFMKLGLQGLSAAQLVWGRLAFGALTLVGLMLLSRRRWPTERRVWGHLLVVSVFFCVVPYSLFAWAGQFLPSGLSSILNATTPVMTLVISAVMLPQERLSRWQIGGVCLGVLGVALIVGPWQLIADPAFLGSIPAQLACLAATACYGIGLSYMRRFVSGTHRYDATSIAAVQLVLAFALASLFAPFTLLTPVRISWPLLLSIVLLGMLGTGFAYVWNTMIVTAWGATRAATVTYLAPVVGVLLGIVVLQERLHWNEPVGGLIVLLGILLSQGLLRRKVRPNELEPVPLKA